MFQFPWFPLPALCVQAGVTPHDGCGVSPFGHPRIDGRSAPPRGLSQPPTSFIGSCRQGIHRWPFVAWVSHYKDARARYEILKGRADEPCSSRKKARAAPTQVGQRTFTTEDRTGTRAPRWASPGRDPDAGECSQLGVQIRHDTNGREPDGIGLLRKEVIQPHLPVRLPCYDFTPIANPTFGSSVPEGSATDFGCCQLSWCDGRCVQGPGTYSPRRC